MGKNILKVLSANGIVAIVGLISSLLLPRILSLDGYAQYQEFLLYLSYIAVLHLGFPTGVSIKYAGKKMSDVSKAQYKAEFIIQLLIPSAFAVMGVLFYFFTREMMALYIAIMVPLYCFLNGFAYLVQAWGNFNLYAMLHVTLSAGSLALPIVYYLFTKRLSGTICILSYLVVYAVVMVFGLQYNFYFTRHCKASKFFSEENLRTEKIGFTFLLGNYINSLLHSIDKQFVQWFCTMQEFAYYSFALTMQSTMTVFITAISQPLFPYLASGKIKNKEQFAQIKRMLLMLGSVAGLAYFGCVFVVMFWIPNYLESLNIIRVYFAVFPAMAVINGLYLNLYKIKRMTQRYVLDLTVMLLVASVANYIAIKFKFGYCGVALATTVVNYLWFFYGQVIFAELSITRKEMIFLIAFVLEFVFVPKIQSPVLGAIVYLILDAGLCWLCFRQEIGLLFDKFKMKKQEKLKLKT